MNEERLFLYSAIEATQRNLWIIFFKKTLFSFFFFPIKVDYDYIYVYVIVKRGHIRGYERIAQYLQHRELIVPWKRKRFE